MSAKGTREDKQTLTVRFRKAIYERAAEISKQGGAYTPSIAQLADRGLEIAVKEHDGVVKVIPIEEYQRLQRIAILASASTVKE